MAKRYTPELWDLDSLSDSIRYESLQWCVTFIENQISDFDDRNETNHHETLSPELQRAFLLTVVAHMEHHLKKVCDFLAEKRNFVVRTVDMRGANGFESCVAYLDKVLQIPMPQKGLKNVRGIVNLRNAVVHQGGHLEALPAIDDDVLSHVSLSGGEIYFASPFVNEASKICRLFVDTILTTVNEQQGPKATAKGRCD